MKTLLVLSLLIICGCTPDHIGHTSYEYVELKKNLERSFLEAAKAHDTLSMKYISAEMVKIDSVLVAINRMPIK
jgi:hypothetical protein